MQTICLLNDSFPPVIDGVANAVLNYGENLHALGDDPIGRHPGISRRGRWRLSLPCSALSCPGSAQHDRRIYGGVPFAPEVMRQLTEHKPALLHSHCPIVSTMLGREFRQVLDVPLVMTYHTKFDVDIANLIHSKVLQESASAPWMKTSMPATRSGPSAVGLRKICGPWAMRANASLCKMASICPGAGSARRWFKRSLPAWICPETCLFFCS